MSRNRKNHHYHYAEKFSDRARRERRSALLFPRRTLFVAVLVLLLFGVITATFSIGDTVQTESADGGSLLVRVRNAKVSQDRSDDQSFAAAATGANVNLASTGAAQYYYRGSQNSWEATQMTVSSDGFYEYISATASDNHQFKIALSSSGWDYNWSYVHASFNDTNISGIGDQGKDNCKCWYTGGNYYLLVYYPNTVVNSTGNPKICASTTLPSNVEDRVFFGEFFTNNSTATQHTMTKGSDNDTFTYTMTLTGGQTHDIYFKVGYGNDNYIKTYKDQNGATMTYDHCTEWQFAANAGSNPKLETVITGSYTFTFVLSTKKVWVTYPSYNITVTKDHSDDTVSADVSTVAIGGSVTLTAADAATDGYDFVKWEITSGQAKTGAYGNTGTVITESTSNPLTIYPCGSASGVTVTAKYALKTYTITYHDGSGPPVTGTISNPNSIPAFDTKTHGQSYTINNSRFIRSGYYHTGWATVPNYTSQSDGTVRINDVDVPVSYYARGASYIENRDLDLYPVWSLSSFSITSITGGEATYDYISPASLQIGISISTGLANDVNRTITYSVMREGQDASAYVSIDNNRYFTTTIPGEYVITCTVTHTSSTGVVNEGQSTSANSGEATITILPGVPVITATMHGKSSGAGSNGNPYKILLGVPYYCTFSVPNIAGYTYKWSTSPTFDTLITDNLSLNSIDLDADYLIGSSTTSNSPTEKRNYTVYCRVTCNGQSNDSVASVVYYYVEKLVLDFKLLPLQKIYYPNQADADLTAEYNGADYQSFTSSLMFSHDNGAYTAKNSAAYTETENFIVSYVSNITNVIMNLLYPAGPKFFMLAITGTSTDPDDSSSHGFSTASPKVHTTVGTTDATVSRTLYFYHPLNIEDVVSTLKNFRVMCYYIKGDGTLGYQAAQDTRIGTDDAGRYYRVIIPADATAVRFGILNPDPAQSGLFYYGSPTLSDGTIGGFSSAAYYGYTDQITLTDDVKVIRSTACSLDGNSKRNITCTTGVYSSVN